MQIRVLSELKPHPLNAEIYGDGCNDELLALIQENGVKDEYALIITGDQAYCGANVIISGHRRFNAAQMAQIHAVPVTVSDKTTQEDIEELLVLGNVGSRERTTEQKAREYKALKRIEAARAKLRQGTRTDIRPNLDECSIGRSDANAAEKVGMKRVTAEKAAKVIDVIDKAKEFGEQAIAQEITETLNKSVDGAYKEVKTFACGLTEEQAKKQLQELHENRRRQEEKKQRRQQQIEEIKVKIDRQNLVVNGVYDVIVVDPPWAYEEKGGFSSGQYDPDNNRGSVDYPTMTVSQLKRLSLPVKKDCVLFLWATHAFLRDAFDLLDTWGFQYKATMVWDKEKMGIGRTIRMQCEFCLLAIKGTPLIEGNSERDIIREARREHSRKPEEFYAKVERMTHGRKIDYFGREQRQGWDVYGIESEKF
jgi:N6-adenosine-specific RNA methylase IME4